MAVVPAVVTEIGRQDRSCYKVTWTGVTENDTCAPVSFPDHNDKSIQVLGTFGTTSVAIHGSNDGGTTFAPLNDPTGTVIGISAAGIKAVLENTEQIKPVLTGGSSTSVTIAMLIHQTQPLRT